MALRSLCLFPDQDDGLPRDTVEDVGVTEVDNRLERTLEQLRTYCPSVFLAHDRIRDDQPKPALWNQELLSEGDEQHEQVPVPFRDVAPAGRVRQPFAQGRCPLRHLPGADVRWIAENDIEATCLEDLRKFELPVKGPEVLPGRQHIPHPAESLLPTLPGLVQGKAQSLQYI